MAPHRVTIEDSSFESNGLGKAIADIVIDGHAEDVLLSGCRLQPAEQTPAIWIGDNVSSLTLQDCQSSGPIVGDTPQVIATRCEDTSRASDPADTRHLGDNFSRG